MAKKKPASKKSSKKPEKAKKPTSGKKKPKEQLPAEGTEMEFKGGKGKPATKSQGPKFVPGQDGNKVFPEQNSAYVVSIRDDGRHTKTQLHCNLSNGSTTHVAREKFPTEVSENF